jgi:hypothetical protein
MGTGAAMPGHSDMEHLVEPGPIDRRRRREEGLEYKENCPRRKPKDRARAPSHTPLVKLADLSVLGGIYSIDAGKLFVAWSGETTLANGGQRQRERPLQVAHPV